MATDSEGLPLALVVRSAGIQDRRGARTLLARLAARFRSIQTIFADGGYQGERLETWVKAMFGYRLELVKRRDTRHFELVPKRWIVERSFSWLNHFRRLSKDYEVRPQSSEAMIYIACTYLMLKRLT